VSYLSKQELFISKTYASWFFVLCLPWQMSHLRKSWKRLWYARTSGQLLSKSLAITSCICSFGDVVLAWDSRKRRTNLLFASSGSSEREPIDQPLLILISSTEWCNVPWRVQLSWAHGSFWAIRILVCFTSDSNLIRSTWCVHDITRRIILRFACSSRIMFLYLGSTQFTITSALCWQKNLLDVFPVLEVPR
jgi:hypothetical protein